MDRRPYVGSLSVDPEDGTLMIGTGLGLFRLEEGAKRAKPFDGRADHARTGPGAISPNLVLRYTGPGELIASGHPKDGGSGLPENLGLIRSEDDGATWTSVSLLGQEDLHALDARGDVVAGQPVEAARVLVSGDGGKTFEERTPPSVPIDLDLDPADPQRIAITTADGVFISPTAAAAGASATCSRPRRTSRGRRPGRCTASTRRACVQVSEDGGESWKPRRQRGRLAVHRDRRRRGPALRRAAPAASIVRSDDGGATLRGARRRCEADR